MRQALYEFYLAVDAPRITKMPMLMAHCMGQTVVDRRTPAPTLHGKPLGSFDEVKVHMLRKYGRLPPGWRLSLSTRYDTAVPYTMHQTVLIHKHTLSLPSPLSLLSLSSLSLSPFSLSPPLSPLSLPLSLSLPSLHQPPSHEGLMVQQQHQTHLLLLHDQSGAGEGKGH
jgi:hypothetical protein